MHAFGSISEEHFGYSGKDRVFVLHCVLLRISVKSQSAADFIAVANIYKCSVPSSEWDVSATYQTGCALSWKLEPDGCLSTS